MKKRILSVLTALALVLTLFPSAAIAAESGAAPDSMGIERGYREEHVSVPDAEDLPSNDELFAGYMAQIMYDMDYSIDMTADYGKKQLSGNDLKIYEILKTKIADIAKDGGKTNEIAITAAQLGLGTSLSDFGLTGNEGDNAILNAIKDKYPIDHSAIISCLLVDCPYELFWYDKTGKSNIGSDGKETAFTMGTSYGYNGTTVSLTWTFSFTVAPEYRASDADPYQATAELSTVNTAIGNAKSIASSAVGDDYSKMLTFKNAICNAVDYNHDALQEGTASGNPWQLIWVFDNDANTKVVCEGYSKAFQYLCDLAGLTCYTVTGTMAGGTGEGPHMWNIVTINNANYLVDVTNCDDGTIGAPDKLFLAGGTPQASWQDPSVPAKYVIYGVTYTFDSDMLTNYSQNLGIFTLSTTDYPRTTPLGGTVEITGTTKYGETLTADTSKVTDPDNKGIADTDLKYQWYRAGAAITGATNSTYTAAKEDVGKALTVAVSTEDYSAVTSAPVTIGKAAPTLTVDKTSLALKTGATGTFTVTLNGVVGESDPLTPSVVSKNNTVASVTGPASGNTYTVTAGSAEGNTEITVSFGNSYYETVTKTVGVNVTTRTVTTVVLKNAPHKQEYVYGETFDPTGLSVTVTYDDQSTEDVSYTSGIGMTFDDISKLNASDSPVTFYGHYMGQKFAISSEDCAIKIGKKPLTDSMVSQPANATYDENQHQPTVTVTDGTLLKESDYSVTYGANTSAGKGTVTVTATPNGNYSGSITKNFTIAKAKPELGMVSLAQGTVVYEATVPGDVSLTCTNTTVNGTLKLTSPANFTGKGGQNVSCTWTFTPADTANYETVTGTISVPVTARSVASIAVATQPTNTSYEYGAPFNPAGLVLSVTYNDSETPVNVPWTEGCGMTFSPETLGDVGSKTVTVTYGNRTAEIQVTVTQKTLTVPADVAWDTTGSPFTYDGEEKSVPLKNEDKIPVELTVTKTGDTGTNAGDYTAKATFALKEGYTAGNYTISASVADAPWTISKANLTGKNASIHVKFDDTVEKIIAASAFGIKEAGTFALKAEGSVTGTGLAENYPSFGEGIKVKLADGLTADSTGDITIPVTFTATNTNYNPIDLTLTVSVTDKTVTEVTAAPFEKTYDGSAVTLAELTANLTATSGGEAVAGDWTTADTLPTNAGDYSLTMTFTPTEAEAYTVETVVISVTIKKAAATVTADDKTITAGDPLPEYTWTVAPAGVDMTNTPVASCEATSSSPAGTYPITVTGNEVSADGNYTITYVNGTLTIEAAVIPEPPVIHVTGVSLDQSVLHLTVGGTAQLIASVAPSNAGNRNVTWSSSEPAVAAVSGGAVTALRPGSAVITVTTVDGGYAASCAVTVTAPVTPPVNPGNPGGGYPTTPVTPVVPNTPSNPGSSNNNNNSSTNNPGDSAPSTPSNSSVAPEATVSGGTASAVVSGDMASQLVDQAASGVSTVVIAPEISGSVNRTEVSIPASAVSGIAGGSSAALKVETPAANITISNSGLASLGGQDVTIAAEKTGGTVSVEITAGGQTVSSVTGGLKVEIPADCGPGTVAQMVDENGNVLSTLRKSYASGQTMNVPLEGSATVIFVDNGKSFADVPAGNWAANAVAFASGHELMNGVSASSFSPAEPMTRGMLAVVLHNLEGNPGASYSGSFGDVGGNDWYAQAVQWAADNSIVTGVSDGVFAPNASITREQLVVMLYRYAGEPNAGGSLTGFSDSANVSSWARQAMAWAVSSGIVGGSNGSLNPQSGATRAEVAQMLMNFVTTGEI